MLGPPPRDIRISANGIHRLLFVEYLSLAWQDSPPPSFDGIIGGRALIRENDR